MTDRPSFNQDFIDFLRALLDESVDFLVVGAHAMAAHGVVRSTGHLDVLVRPNPENAERVVRALPTFGAPLASHGVNVNDFATTGTVYQVGLPPSRIDVLTEISGVNYDDAVHNCQRITVADLEFRVPSRHTLLVNKRATGRSRDMDDVRLLEAIGDTD